MQIEVFGSPETAKQAAVQKITQLLLEARNTSVLFLSSGGSCVDLLNHIPESVISSSITLAVTDERFSGDPLINNFAQLTKTKFYESLMRCGGKVISTLPVPDETLDDLATRYEQKLREWFALHPNGTVIATLGVGADGHTAGILPFPEDESAFKELFLDPAHWVVGYNAEGKTPYPLRVTTTVTFLNNAVTEAVVFAVGEDKFGALVQMQHMGNIASMPAQVINNLLNVTVFTDAKLSP